MRNAVDFVDEMNFLLPPFAYWRPEDWEKRGDEYNEIRDNMLVSAFLLRAIFTLINTK